MSTSLKSIADKTNKHKETLKNLEAQNKEYWLSSLYTLLECPKIIAEHLVSCAQKGLYECRISREWLYSRIKERNNSFDLEVESDEFVLLYLFCLKNIIETYENKYDIICYGIFCNESKRYITPELKVNWEGSETEDKSKTKEDESDLDGMIKSLVATAVSFFGLAIFFALDIDFFKILFVLSIILFLICDICFLFRLLLNDDEVEIRTNKTKDDINQFDGIYEAMITTTKEQKLKEVYSKVVDTFGYNINRVENIKLKVEGI